jgi:transposase-like protein
MAYLSTKEAARYLGLSASCLAHWRIAGKGPPFHSIVHPGGRRPTVRYQRADLDAWVRQYERGSKPL